MGDPLSNQTASPPQAPVTAMPRRLGRYELITQLAKGGMGEVYLARTRGVGGFERLVVVKCALPSLAEQTQQMLLAEARLAATLQHTNIVQVHDVDTDAGTLFLAMEFLHGQDARYLLRRSWGKNERVPLEVAVAIGLAVCAGLHYAHERRDPDGQPLGIVHRDISPSNVFITYDGGVKLIDFGIAKATALPSETLLGNVKGKPGYMSPEQCRCEPLDRRSDVFCVGILLYELTLGVRPFRADNEYLLHKQIIEEQPPLPSALDTAYPPVLEKLVMRALAKDRRERPATALALQEELTDFAAAQRLDVSQFALGRYMARLFGEELAAWQDAVRSGQSLVEHVIRRTTSTVRILDAPPPGEAPAGTSERAGAAVPIESASRGRRRLWPLAMGAAAIGGAIAITVALRTPSTSPSPPTTSMPTTSMPTTAGAAQPGATIPTTSGSGASTAGASSPGAALPGGASMPASATATGAGASQPEASTAAAAQPGASRPEASTAAAAQPGASQPATSHGGASRGGASSGASRGGAPSSGASHGGAAKKPAHPPKSPPAETHGPDDIL